MHRLCVFGREGEAAAIAEYERLSAWLDGDGLALNLQLESVVIDSPDMDWSQYGMPDWFLNRQKDRETGINDHLISSDLVLRTKTDIDQMKKVRSWKGFRHSHGLKVRGQRTRTTGRKGKAMGVRKKQVRKCTIFILI